MFQRLRLEPEASHPCSSRQHRLTCWHVLHTASPRPLLVFYAPAPPARRPASSISGRHNLRCTLQEPASDETSIVEHTLRMPSHTSCCDSIFAVDDFFMRIAGLICSRLFMPLAAIGLACPLSARAFRLGLGPGRFCAGRFRAFPGGAAGCGRDSWSRGSCSISSCNSPVVCETRGEHRGLYIRW